jgi:hypothetical protein
VGSALVDILTALSTQEQWLDPEVVKLLRVGQGEFTEQSSSSEVHGLADTQT